MRKSKLLAFVRSPLPLFEYILTPLAPTAPEVGPFAPALVTGHLWDLYAKAAIQTWRSTANIIGPSLRREKEPYWGNPTASAHTSNLPSTHPGILCEWRIGILICIQRRTCTGHYRSDNRAECRTAHNFESTGIALKSQTRTQLLSPKFFRHILG
jgi:hypothetical protein